MKVLVLAGGNSREREVSIRSGQAVADSLKKAGHEVTLSDPKDENFDLPTLSSSNDVVFIALHGAGGEDGIIQKQLEIIGAKFVGSDSKASELCMDKWLYKQLLNQHKVPNPAGKIVTIDDINDAIFSKPFVLKPFNEGSSVDTLIARKITDDTAYLINELLLKYPQMLCEELIEGSEITVGIWNDKALPVIEIIPPGSGEFDYENKYNGQTQELCPPINVSLDLQEKAQKLAKEIHEFTGCRDISRTDIMIDKSNNLFVLETNTIPGLTNHSLLPKMVQTAGYTMEEFVDQLVKSALSRQS